MLSGGGECTLVKWDVEDAVNKRTLPRLGLPIRHVSGSYANILTAVSHADNSKLRLRVKTRVINSQITEE